MKKCFYSLMLIVFICLCSAFTGSLMNVNAGQGSEEILIAEDLNWLGNPKCGWTADGTCDVKKNENVAGGSIVVNGVTYSNNTICTHLPATDVDQDIEYDISQYSGTYNCFEVLVGQPDNGDNALIFSVLVDGVLKDTINWRQGASFSNKNLVYLRCDISQATKLTLRVNQGGYGYACGAAVFVNPRLFKADDTERVWASDILNRYENATSTGWDYGFSYKVMLDAFPNGKKLYYEDNIMEKFEKGLGIQLKGTTYEDYEDNKNNQDLYVSMKWNIEGKDYRFFNTLVAMNLSYGCHVDVIIDGVEIYKSGKIDSMGTVAYNGEWIANANKTVNVNIPKDSKLFELRVIPVNGIGDGLVGLCNAAFFKDTKYLYGRYAEETYCEVWPHNLTRGFMWDGSNTKIYDSQSQTSVLTEHSMFSIAGDGLNTMPTYKFLLDEGDGYNSFSSKVGLINSASPAKVFFNARVIYNDGSDVKFSSEEVSIANSNIDFKFIFDSKGAKEIDLYISSDSSSNSESIWNEPILEKKTIYKYVNNGKEELKGYNVGEVISAPTVEEKDGYQFLGWKEKDSSNYFNFESPVSGDKTLYAEYKQTKFSITYYNLKGEERVAATYSPSQFKQGDNLVLPSNDEIPGYRFLGWYYEEQKINSFPSVEKDIELVAKYEEIFFDVCFKNGDIENHESVKWGNCVTKPDNPLKNNYSFDNWYLNDKVYDFTNVVEDNITLIAKFNPEQYQVTVYNLLEEQDAALTNKYNITHTYGVKTELPQAIELTGYEFIGWFYNSSKITALEALTYTSDFEITAKYSLKIYTVKFMNGDETINTQYVKYNKKATGLENPIKTGSQFDNWYIGEDVFDFDTLITEDLNIVAKFIPNKYNVEFVVDGTKVATIKVNYGEKVQEIEEPLKKDYTFTGWYNGDVEFDFDTLITCDLTLEAKLEKDTKNSIVLPITIISSSLVVLAGVAFLLIKKAKR